MQVAGAPLDIGGVLADSKGAVATMLKVTVELYRIREARKGRMSPLDQMLLRTVSATHSHWIGSESPPEFELGEDGRPVTVNPLKIATQFTSESLRRSQRIELVELMEVLSVLKEEGEGKIDDGAEGLAVGSCALWQLILELHRWMSTELPLLLDERRSHPGWADAISARIHYLDTLRSLYTRAAESGGLAELDPATRRDGVAGFLFGNFKDSIDAKRLPRVLVTMSRHLTSIRDDHARVLKERTIAEVLQNLEHSVKAVVRPVLHAGLITMSNIELPAGMVFSELLDKESTDEYSWMHGFKQTALCKLLSLQIRCDASLQECLHIGGGGGSIAGPQERHIEAHHLADYCISGKVEGPEGLMDCRVVGVPEIPGSKRGAKNAANEARKMWAPPLQKLIQACRILAKEVGVGMSALKQAQMEAKMKGEDQFSVCSEHVTRYLLKLKAVVEKMLETVKSAHKDLDEIHARFAVDVKVDQAHAQQNQHWGWNLQQARKLLHFAEGNLSSIETCMRKMSAQTEAAATHVKTNDTMKRARSFWDAQYKAFSGVDALDPQAGTAAPQQAPAIAPDDYEYFECEAATECKDSAGLPDGRILPRGSILRRERGASELEVIQVPRSSRLMQQGEQLPMADTLKPCAVEKGQEEVPWTVEFFVYERQLQDQRWIFDRVGDLVLNSERTASSFLDEAHFQYPTDILGGRFGHAHLLFEADPTDLKCLTRELGLGDSEARRMIRAVEEGAAAASAGSQLRDLGKYLRRLHCANKPGRLRQPERYTDSNLKLNEVFPKLDNILLPMAEEQQPGSWELEPWRYGAKFASAQPPVSANLRRRRWKRTIVRSQLVFRDIGERDIGPTLPEVVSGPPRALVATPPSPLASAVTPVSDLTAASGTVYDVLAAATVRAGPESSSNKLGEFKKGAVIEVVNETVNNGLTVVQTTTVPDGASGGGWCKLKTSKGKLLLSKRAPEAVPLEPAEEDERAHELSGPEPEPEPESQLKPAQLEPEPEPEPLAANAA